MMNNIAVVNGNELCVKEYNGERVLTIWDIARLHNEDANNIKKNYNNNKEYFTEGEDYFVVEKQSEFARNLILSKEIDHHAVNATKSITVFTESGYLLLVKPMTGKLAWAVQKQLVKNYFAMKEVRQVIQKEIAKQEKQEKQGMTAEVAVDSAKFIIDLCKAAGVSVQSQVLCAKELYRNAGIELPINIQLEEKLFDLEQIANKLGVLSQNNKPHAQAMSEIIKRLNIPEEMKVITFESKGNWQGSVTKYKESIFEFVTDWLNNNKYPELIETDKRKLKVVYRNH